MTTITCARCVRRDDMKGRGHVWLAMGITLVLLLAAVQRGSAQVVITVDNDVQTADQFTVPIQFFYA